MNKNFAVIALIIFFCGIEIYSQTYIGYANKFNFNFGFHYSSSGSFYNLKEKQIVYQLDTLRDTNNTAYTKKFTYDLREYIIDFGLSYGISKDLSVLAEIPFMINTLTEEYSTDTFALSPTYGLATTRGNFSLFMPLYYKFGTKLRLDSGFISEFISTEFKIPPKFKNGYQNDTTKGLYKYAAYELLIGANSIISFAKSWIEVGMMYNFRSGKFNDQLLVSLNCGFSSVPNTSFRIMMHYCQDMGSFTNAIPYDQRYTTIQENYLDLGAAFRANLSKSFYSDISYLIRLGLKNTSAGGKFIINGVWAF